MTPSNKGSERKTLKPSENLKNQLIQAENHNEYENLSHRELVEKTRQLENRIEELETKFEVFKDQVQKSLPNQ